MTRWITVVFVVACSGKKESPPSPPPSAGSAVAVAADAAATIDAPAAPALPVFAAVPADAALTFDADNIYVLTTKLEKIAKAGGKRTTLVDDLGGPHFSLVVIAAGHVVACQSDGHGCMRIPLAGGSVQKLGKGPTPNQINADDHALYIVQDDKAVERITFDDQKEETVVPAPKGETDRALIAVDDGLLFADTLTAPDGKRTTRLVRVSKDGAAKDLGALPFRPLQIEPDGKTLYLLGNDQIDATAVGGATTKLADWDLAVSATMRVDTKALYFGIANADSALYRLAKTGGKVEKVRDLPPYVQLVDVDAKTLWVRSKDALHALPKL